MLLLDNLDLVSVKYNQAQAFKICNIFFISFSIKRFYCIAPLNDFANKDAIVNILYYYYYYYYEHKQENNWVTVVFLSKLTEIAIQVIGY